MDPWAEYGSGGMFSTAPQQEWQGAQAPSYGYYASPGSSGYSPYGYQGEASNPNMQNQLGLGWVPNVPAGTDLMQGVNQQLEQQPQQAQTQQATTGIQPQSAWEQAQNAYWSGSMGAGQLANDPYGISAAWKSYEASATPQAGLDLYNAYQKSPYTKTVAQGGPAFGSDAWNSYLANGASGVAQNIAAYLPQTQGAMGSLSYSPQTSGFGNQQLPQNSYQAAVGGYSQTQQQPQQVQAAGQSVMANGQPAFAAVPNTTSPYQPGMEGKFGSSPTTPSTVIPEGWWGKGWSGQTQPIRNVYQQDLVSRPAAGTTPWG